MYYFFYFFTCHDACPAVRGIQLHLVHHIVDISRRKRRADEGMIQQLSPSFFIYFFLSLLSLVIDHDDNDE